MPFDERGPKSTLEEVTLVAVPPVEPLRVNAVQPVHPTRDVCIRRLYEKVIVDRCDEHDAVGARASRHLPAAGALCSMTQPASSAPTNPARWSTGSSSSRHERNTTGSQQAPMAEAASTGEGTRRPLLPALRRSREAPSPPSRSPRGRRPRRTREPRDAVLALPPPHSQGHGSQPTTTIPRTGGGWN
jgi:hypothetical protein